MAGVIYEDVEILELSEMGRGERVEKLVDIYESAEAFRFQETSTEKETQTQQTVAKRGSRCYRLAAVCVGQCVLLLAIIILLYMYYVQMNTAKDRTISSLRVNFTAERENLLSSIRSLTEERDQLKISNQNLTEERDQLKNSKQNLTEEGDQLRNSNKKLTEERDQLKNSTKKLTEERDQLKNSTKKLTEDNDLLKVSNKDLAEERDQLKMSTKTLTEEREQLKISTKTLTEEKDQLKISIKTLTEEKYQLNISHQDLIKERDQLKISYNHLAKQFVKISSPEWTKFESSFYYFSTEKETWSDARQDCREREADLLIINSSEEQMFFVGQEKELDFWIGLNDRETESDWKWVDGQTLTLRFWKKGEPNNGAGKEDCVAFTTIVEDHQRTWNDLPCSQRQYWVCETDLKTFRLDSK